MKCLHTNMMCRSNDSNECQWCPVSPQGQEYLADKVLQQKAISDRLAENMDHIISNNEDPESHFSVTITIGGQPVTYVLEKDSGAVVRCDDPERNAVIQELQP